VRSAGVRRAGVLALGAVIGAVGFASAASAHVTVSPTSAPQGGYTVITFRVPTESATASTTKLDVYLDMTHPVASVNVQQVPGWTATVKQQKLPTPIKDDDGNTVTSAAGEIVWTANSAASAIHPGQFQQFPVQLGPLPANTSSMAFKALQTYSDGSIVRWIDTPVAGQPEPDHPTPILTLTKAGTDGTASAPGASAGVTVAAPAPAAAAKPNNTWGIVGALLGLIGALLGGLAYARSRNTGPQG